MTSDLRWTSFDLVFFDCDSTLSTIEGIDELGRLTGKEAEIADLTNRAMNGELDLSEVYGARLRAIEPTRAQLKAIEEHYWETRLPDAAEVVAALHALGKTVFVISGGLAEPVRGFAARLGVPPERVRAVELEYNRLAGDWWRYHEPSAGAQASYLAYDNGPLTVSSGKAQVVRELAADTPGRRVMIGDGSSDLAARPAVDLFVGFGGVVARDKVRAEADVFLSSIALAPLLPVIGGPGAARALANTPHADAFARGLALAQDGALHFNNPDLQRAFEEAFA